jgi:hypothetical protein
LQKSESCEQSYASHGSFVEEVIKTLSFYGNAAPLFPSFSSRSDMIFSFMCMQRGPLAISLLLLLALYIFLQLLIRFIA